jgi:uncharacterized repeat protein (TIGR01451 family)
MKRTIFTVLLAFFFIHFITAQNINYADSWGEAGLTIKSKSENKIVFNYSIQSFHFSEQNIDGENMLEVSLPDIMLPNDEGAPNLPGMGKFVALPQGAMASVTIINKRTETLQQVSIAPAPRIPWDTEKGPLEYAKDNAIYSVNAFYPSNPVKLSEQTDIRGVDAVMMGITPFQYNPVTKELVVYRDMEIEVTFEGGNGHYGEDRLRSRWWDPIHRNIFINESSLPEMDYNKSYQGTKDVGCEYLIISPTNQEFLNWADSIKQFRTLQGIMTDIITLDEIGANNVNTIESFINSAYDSWEVVPSAVLILGDYGTSSTNSVISPIWDYYCVSDNIYSDVNNNDMPDIIFARITANNDEQLEVMVTKFLDYERNPPTSENYYNHPITALGWQTERWFQICSETVGGYMKNELGKEPVRINEIYGGNPNNDPWSTAQNTYTIMNVFGPNGLDYIPSSPSDLGDWSGGNNEDILDAIHNGSFMLMHRDHGFEQGWGEPAFNNSDIGELTNTDLTFIFSVNCLTGKYNLASECFTEKFHRHTYNGQNSGALGLIAASEVSYSFVNDTYVWGMFDYLWPDFLPQYGSSVDNIGFYPAFANAAGKYFLNQSSWPYNTGNKEVTYNLFHHHGDAFLGLYTEVPQEMIVLHNQELLEGAETFSVMVEDGAFVSLTVDGEIIGTGEATDGTVEIAIPGQAAGSVMVVTVTKHNSYRYEKEVNVIDSDIAYVVQNSFNYDEVDGNGNGLVDYGETISFSVSMQNQGNVAANNVEVLISTESEFITFTDDSEVYGNFQPGDVIDVTNAFELEVSPQIPDNELVIFDLTASDGTDSWTSNVYIISHAPELMIMDFVVSDPTGNNNGRIDPGETVEVEITVKNNGSSKAYGIIGDLTCEDDGITINTDPQEFGDMQTNYTVTKTYEVYADPSIENGIPINFNLNMTGESDYTSVASYATVVGQLIALVLDLDPANHSGPAIFETFANMDVYAEYETSFPEDLGLYKNIFLSLGLKFNNYELTLEEGNRLQEYLENGGNLYMEGRVTWKDDLQTAVHPMFNIEVNEMSMFAIYEVNGVAGSLADMYAFEYEGATPIIDYSIEGIAPASNLFTTQDDDHFVMVAYDEGSYRTIGSTVELGKLVETEWPNTQTQMVNFILDWFEDGIVTGVDEMNGQSSVGFMCYPNPASDQINLEFTLNVSESVSISMMNILGETVYNQSTERFDAGNQKHVIETSGIPSGVYFINIGVGGKIFTNKITVQ